MEKTGTRKVERPEADCGTVEVGGVEQGFEVGSEIKWWLRDCRIGPSGGN